MARGKHRQTSFTARRLGAAVVVGAGSMLLVSGVSAASAAPAANSCAESLSDYQDAAKHELDTATRLNIARDNDTQATDRRTAAIKDANATYTTWVANHPKATDAERADAQAKRDATIAEAHQAYAAGKTAQVLAAAEADENAARLDRDDKKATADNACQGKPGADGKDGVIATITLRPNVCARVALKPDTREVLRVIAYLPCPPASADRPGESTTTQQEAQAPQTVQSHLPVTH